MVFDNAGIAQQRSSGFVNRRLRVQIPLPALELVSPGGISPDDTSEQISDPDILIILHGQVPKRPKGTDCKSVALALRRFESYPAHQNFPTRKILVAPKRALNAPTRGIASESAYNKIVASVVSRYANVK